MKRRAVSLFSNDLEAVFVKRPNRFLILARRGNKIIPCHCPNPGRLIEFFGLRGHDIPGIKLILEKRNARAKAKTAYTAVGLYYTDALTKKEAVAPLFSSRANKAAELLILETIIPGLREVKAEYVMGNSRFDFYCTAAGGRRHVVEVKACSLVEYGAAMFPDAPSERALKHLEELAELSRRGYRCHVLFVIVHGKPEVFIPNLHTDPALASGLYRLGRAALPAAKSAVRGAVRSAAGKGPVLIHAALLRVNKNGDAVLAAPVPVDLGHGKLAEQDRGSYLVALELERTAEAETEGPGRLRFRAGWYVYAGDAEKKLRQELRGHERKTRGKKIVSPLDYLAPLAKTIKTLPMGSYRSLGCALSEELAALGGSPVVFPEGPDSSGRSPARLFYFSSPPLEDRRFVDMLFRYRHAEALRPR